MDIDGVPSQDSPVSKKQESGGCGQTKKCTKCGKTKKLSEFCKMRASKDGLQRSCKSCAKAYYAASKERRAAYDAAYHAANKERRAAYYAAYYAENKERMAASMAAWKKANPEKVRAYIQRRRAKKANAQGTFTADDWKQRLAYHSYRCVYCGVEKHETPEGWLSCDHMIPLAKGGTNWPSNLVPACRSCNSSKGPKTYFEFIEYMKEKNNE